MAKTYTGLSGHYGALELKAKYQRNMFLGTLFSVFFCATLVTSALLYQYLTTPEMVIINPTDISPGGDGIIDLRKPPIFKETEPAIRARISEACQTCRYRGDCMGQCAGG